MDDKKKCPECGKEHDGLHVTAADAAMLEKIIGDLTDDGKKLVTHAAGVAMLAADASVALGFDAASEHPEKFAPDSSVRVGKMILLGIAKRMAQWPVDAQKEAMEIFITGMTGVAPVIQEIPLEMGSNAGIPRERMH